MRTVQFVCVRGAHHRRGPGAASLCEHLGCGAYCPAGDVPGHEWMPTSTDLSTLVDLGYVRAPKDDHEDDAVDDAALIHR